MTANKRTPDLSGTSPSSAPNDTSELEQILNEFRRQTIVIDGGSVRGPDEDARAFRQSLEDTKAKIEAHYSRQQKAAVEAARLDELETLWPKFTDIKSDGTNGLEDNPTARKYIDARISELRAGLNKDSV